MSGEWSSQTPELELRGHSSGTARLASMVASGFLYVLAFGGLSCMVISVVQLVRFAGGEKPGRGGIGTPLFLLVWGIFWCVAGVFFARLIWKRSQRARLRVFSDGFEVDDRRHSRRLAWDAVESACVSIVANTPSDPGALIVVLIVKLFGGTLEPSCSLTLELTSGEALHFDNRFPGITGFSDRVSRELVLRRLPDDSERFRNGETLEFGPVVISNRELTINNKTIRLDEVERVSIANGALEVWRTGTRRRWARIDTGNIPNCDVLAGLLTATGHFPGD